MPVGTVETSEHRDHAGSDQTGTGATIGSAGVILRCTRKMPALLDVRAAALADRPSSEDDWYMNLIWLDRRKCLLLVHAETLFPVFVADVRAAQLRPLGPFVVGAITTEAASEGLPLDVLGELDAEAVVLAKTASRSVLGFMNDMVYYLDHVVAEAGALGRVGYEVLNRDLRRQLHSRGGYATPLELVDRRLRAREYLGQDGSKPSRPGGR
jgi:hypothetical protein